MKKIFLFLMASAMAVISSATTYGIWIKGEQVTSTNCSDVLGDGMFSFDAATNTLTMNGGTLEVPFSKYNDKFWYDCAIFVPYEKQSAFTDNTTKTYTADVFLKEITFKIKNSNTIVNTNDEVADDAIHHDGIFTRVPTRFEGSGTLHIKGFNRYVTHFKDNVTFASGRYYFENTCFYYTYNESTKEYTWGEGGHPVIYQEGSKYTLKFQDAFLRLHNNGDYYSAIGYEGKVDASGIGEYKREDNSELSYAYKTPIFKYGHLYDTQGHGPDKGFCNRLRRVCLLPKNGPFYDMLGSGYWVTSDNHTDVLKDGGSVRYDYVLNALILSQAKVDLSGKSIWPQFDDMKVCCYGENIITASQNTHFALDAGGINNITFDAPTIETLNKSYFKIGDDTLTIRAPYALRVKNMKVSNMSLKLEGSKDAIMSSGTIMADVQEDEGTKAFYGSSITYPILWNDKLLTAHQLLKLFKQYGNKFNYDKSVNRITLNGLDLSDVSLGFTEKGALYAQGDCKLKSLYVGGTNKAMTVEVYAIGNLTIGSANNVSGLIIGDKNSLIFRGGGRATVKGSGIPVVGQGDDNSLVVSATSLTLAGNGTSATMAGINALSVYSAYLTSPFGAKFVESKKSVCVSNIPTKSDIVISTVKPAEVPLAVTLSASATAVHYEDSTVTLTAMVQGPARLGYEWQYRDENDTKWRVPSSSGSGGVTAEKANAGYSLTRKYTPSSYDVHYRDYRLMLRTVAVAQPDTIYSNVVRIENQYKVTLFDGGYVYNTDGSYLYKHVSDMEEVWIGNHDTIWLKSFNDCLSTLTSRNLVHFEENENGWQIYKPDQNAGEVHSHFYKYELWFWSSIDRSDAKCLKAYYSVDALQCGETMSEKGFVVPDAPETDSPFVGWYCAGCYELLTSDEILNMTITDDMNFYAIYEKDFDPISALPEVTADDSDVSKFMWQGHVYIMRDGRIYTITGAIVE